MWIAMAKKIKVSVLMLAYNHQEFILDAIQSIEKNLSDELCLELLVLDDGSDDNTVNVVKKYIENASFKVALIENEHEGVRAIAKNLNTLIRRSEGEYICFLTSDDMFSDKRFCKQISIMEDNKNIVLCYANGVNVVNGVETGRVHKGRDLELLKMRSISSLYEYVTTHVPSLFVQSALIRKDFVAEMESVYDEELVADDWVLNIRLFERIIQFSKKIEFVDDVVFYRNIHGSNTSSNLPVHFDRVIEVIEKYCKNKNKKKMKAKTIADFLMVSIYQKKYLLAYNFLLKLKLEPSSVFFFLSHLMKTSISKLNR